MLWIAHSHQATCVVTRELRHTSFIRIVDGSLPVELPWPPDLQSHRTSSRGARISRRSALYDGALHLGRASGNEPFETMAEGAPKIETVEQGEVIWRDARGVTCRRWNWRQGIRSRITEHSTEMWFVLERLDPMPTEALLEAGERLIEGLRRLSPDVSTFS